MFRLQNWLRMFMTLAVLVASSVAGAQQLPVSVHVSGDVATVRIGPAAAPVADMTITFDDVAGLTPASLGVRADSVNVLDPALIARLPSSSLTSIPSAFPVLITVEPPASGGLSFQRQAHLDLHAYALSYTAGTRLRLFRAPLNGAFVDITSDVAPGSVRTRGTTGGWSQFLIITDTRATGGLVNDKIAALQTMLQALRPIQRGPLQQRLDRVQTAVNAGQYDFAITQIDAFRARVSNQAGTGIPDVWRATRDLVNSAGDLLSGADSLRYSIAYLRDYGS